nr:uroplakin-3a isoform X2 [Chlorocebus sabaeus]
MPPLWALLALGCLRFGSAVNLQPQLASVTFATNNPTLTTVALEKPLCMFDSSEALTGTHQVYLYVLVDSASSRNASVQDSAKTPLGSTFLQTEGGRTGPYKAVAFDLIPCSDLPSLDAVGDVSQASQILNAYLVKVGANRTCLWDPNFQGLCNPPLSAATEYSHPILSDRHVARPAERRHDRHHFHPGLPALLSTCGFCWCHCPQPRVSTQLGRLDPRDTPDLFGLQGLSSRVLQGRGQPERQGSYLLPCGWGLVKREQSPGISKREDHRSQVAQL